MQPRTKTGLFPLTGFLFLLLSAALAASPPTSNTEETPMSAAPNKPHFLTAKIVAKAGQEARIEELLRGLVATTRAEDGCLFYDLHRSTEDPRVFMFMEGWASYDQWFAHRNAPHIAGWERDSEGLIEDWEILPLERLEE